jgi:hypothetical protein
LKITNFDIVLQLSEFRLKCFEVIQNKMSRMRLSTNVDDIPAKKTRGGRENGCKNMNKAHLLKVITTILPVNALSWDFVAETYRRDTGHPTRDGSHIKTYFMKNMCVDKKPTGQSAPDEFVAESNRVYSLIVSKESAGNIGCGSSDSSSDANEETEPGEAHDELIMLSLT